MTMSTLVFYPFAYALLDTQHNDYCWYCLKGEEQGITLQYCAACRSALFCGQECLRLGRMDHKAECIGLKENRPLIPKCNVRLLGRAVLRHMQIKNGEHLKTKDFFLNRNSRSSLMDLCKQEEKIRRDVKKMLQFKEMYGSLCRFYRKKYLLPKDEIFKIYTILSLKCYDINNQSNGEAIAKGLYLDLSAYNHSCRPNAAFKTDRLVATLYPVVEGVDLADTKNTFISYIPLLLPKGLRQKALKGSWFFDCKCVRCLDERDHLLTALRCPECTQSVTIYDINNKLKKDPLVCGSCGHKLTHSVDAAVKDMERIDRMLEDPVTAMLDLKNVIAEFENKLGKENIYLTHLYNAAFQRMETWQFAQRLDYMLKSLPCLLMCHPKNHPFLARFYKDLATNQHGCKDRKSAMENLDEALRKLTVSVGTEDPMYEQCKIMWDLNMNKEQFD